MAAEILKRDQNDVTVLGGITDNAAQEVTMLRVNPVTKRLLVTATGAGTGDVVGPASAVNGNLAVFDGTSGKLIKDGGPVPSGGGTVTSVSVVTANGVSGSVATATTTPAITLTLGAITPSSVTSTGAVNPSANDGAALGSTSNSWSDLFLASGALINFANGNVVLTHSSAILTVSTGDLRVTTAGTNSASVVTVGGTQTLTSKTLTTPVISSISNTGTLTLPTSTDTLVGRATTDTLTNKTLTAPVISTISNTGTLTLPTSTDTLVGRATTDTLTNKTLTTPTITKPVMNATNPTAQTYAPAGGGTATLDLALSNQHYVSFPAGNITVALTNDTNNQIFLVSLTQDATGSRTVTWFTTIKWAGGVAPTLTTTANKRDTFGFIRTGSGTYDGFVIGQNI